MSTRVTCKRRSATATSSGKTVKRIKNTLLPTPTPKLQRQNAIDESMFLQQQNASNEEVFEILAGVMTAAAPTSNPEPPATPEIAVASVSATVAPTVLPVGTPQTPARAESTSSTATDETASTASDDGMIRPVLCVGYSSALPDDLIRPVLMGGYSVADGDALPDTRKQTVTLAEPEGESIYICSSAYWETHAHSWL